MYDFVECLIYCNDVFLNKLVICSRLFRHIWCMRESHLHYKIEWHSSTVISGIALKGHALRFCSKVSPAVWKWTLCQGKQAYLVFFGQNIFIDNGWITTIVCGNQQHYDERRYKVLLKCFWIWLLAVAKIIIESPNWPTQCTTTWKSKPRK